MRKYLTAILLKLSFDVQMEILCDSSRIKKNKALNFFCPCRTKESEASHFMRSKETNQSSLQRCLLSMFVHLVDVIFPETVQMCENRPFVSP